MVKNKTKKVPSNKFKSEKDTKVTHAHQQADKHTDLVSSKKVVNYLFSKEAIPLYALGLLVFSIYVFIAVISYFFTWQIDDVWLASSKPFSSSHAYDVANAGGSIGAYVAYHLVKRGIGIGAFAIIAFVFVLALLGLKLYKFSVKKLLTITLLLMIYSSLVGGYLFPKHLIVGGIFGFSIMGWLVKLVGYFFSGIILLGLGLLLVAVFVPDMIQIMKNLIHKKELEQDQSIAVENNTFSEDSTDESKEKLDQDNVNELGYNFPTSTDHADNTQDEKPISQEIEFLLKPYRHDTLSLDGTDNIASNDVIQTFQHNTEGIEQKQSTEDELLPVDTENNRKVVPLYVDETHLDGQADLIDREGADFQHLIEDPVLSLKHYKYPSTELLKYHNRGEAGVTREELEANKNKIVETLRNYEIDIVKIKATIGPTVTMYEIVPAAGVRISKIRNLEDDIALSLSALGIRIIAPIPGKGTIGIEVPNQKREIVSLRSLLESDKLIHHTGELPFALGKTITNEPFVADLAKLPHLLIAGATGQGKSVGINSIICSLLFKKHPSQLKFIFIDPKKVELAPYNKLENHFLAKLPDENEAIVTDVTKVVKTLTSLTKLMDWRYDLLKEAGVKNIVEYNQKYLQKRLNPQKGHHYMPYIVVVIDEFADLIMTAGKEVELPVARIAQLARAVGIHMIVATQRPSVDVITGKIKANFPARIAFRVSSKVDSRTILDYNGAEQLIGMGDMLYLHGSDFLRLQCPYVDTEEIERIVDFIGSQVGYPSPFPLPEVEDEDQSGDIRDVGNLDKLFSEAAKIVVATQQGSTSLLQTKLNIGFARARRIIEQLEQAGIVGPPQGSKPRDVLIKDLHHLEQFLSNLN